MAAQGRDPNVILGPVSYGALSLLVVRRKLEEAALVLADADESEHLQAVGLTCREALIALGQEILVAAGVDDDVALPQGANFKVRARLAIDRLLPGASNADLRAHARKVSDAAWEFAAALTHAPNRSSSDAAICLSLAGAVHALFENLLDKAEAESGINTRCPVCQSRRLEIVSMPSGDDGALPLLLMCEHCGWETRRLPADGE